MDELEKIVGVFSYVAECIPRFALRVSPLRNLLTQARWLDGLDRRRGGPRPSNALFPLGVEEMRAFQDLRGALSTPAVISPFDPSKEAIVISDASQAAIAGVLYQLADDGTPRMVGLFSRALREAEARWPVFDLEALALVESLKRWRHYLRAVRVLVLSDHKGLSCLFREAPRLSGKAARWWETLCEFDVEVRHVPGSS